MTDPVDTNKSLPREPAAAGAEPTNGGAAAGPHSSSLADKADPMVNSDLEGSRGFGNGPTGTTGPDSGLTGTSLPEVVPKGQSYLLISYST